MYSCPELSSGFFNLYKKAYKTYPKHGVVISNNMIKDDDNE